MKSSNDHIRLAEHVSISKKSDGLALLDINRGTIFTINTLGTLAIDLSQSGNSKTKIAEIFSVRFKIDQATALNDLETFATCLRDMGLLER